MAFSNITEMERKQYTTPDAQVIQLEVSSDVMGDIGIIRQSTDEPEYSNRWYFDEQDDNSGDIVKTQNLWE